MKPFFSYLLLIILTLTGSVVQAQQFTNYTTANGLPSINVNGVAVDGNNLKWIGTQAGVARFD
ncbi:MAG: hypothetical protein NTW16_18415, partial [Bacteroidetes bacterium]|nr:hypothetical protein [Bacteroidota bacterium]